MAMHEVAEAAVIAIPDDKWQERPLACVVLRSGRRLELSRLHAHLSAHGFASWQLPDRDRGHRRRPEDERRQVRQEGAAGALRRAERFACARAILIGTSPRAWRPTARCGSGRSSSPSSTGRRAARGPRSATRSRASGPPMATISSSRDRTVSRFHCELSVRGNTIIIRDCGSTNGTLIDGVRVREAEIPPGTLVRIGGSAFRVELGDEPAFVEVSGRTSFGELVGASVEMRRLYAILERIAHGDATVLVQGETGTGKDVVARSLHAASPRAAQPFVAVDCGAIPEHLVESELFGHVRGAFTGATGRSQGRVRGGRRRHAVPRRDRRDADRAAAEAPPRDRVARRSAASAAASRGRSTSASSPPPTARCRARSTRGRSARTSTTAWPWSSSACRRSARAATTSPCSRRTSSSCRARPGRASCRPSSWRG